MHTNYLTSLSTLRQIYFFPVLLMLALLLSSAQAIAVQGQVIGAEFDTGSILVQFKPGTSVAQQSLALSNAGCRKIGTNTQNTLLSGSGQFVHASIISGQSVSNTIKSIAQNSAVLFAEPNYLLYSAATIPDDPMFPQLYSLNNTGQTGGAIDADMDAVEAWDLTTGSDITVAVIDSGIELAHEDLAANIWLNAAEIANNNIDDDGNGYIDDTNGWDFTNNDNDPSDDNDHGTHVSGTIAAVGDNGIGVSGVSWQARIMPLKFMNAAGVGTTANAIAAINYAVANGARVINASWGGPNFSAALQTAISAANDVGVLFVAAAGNTGSDNDFSPNYPASYALPNIISVAAVDDNDVWANFSNWGLTSVDLGAAGVAIVSTIRGNAYASQNGTSMAAPQITGAVALLWSYNAAVSAVQIKDALLGTVNPVPSLTGWTVSGGSLNVFAAMNALPAPPPPPPPPANLSMTPNVASLKIGDTMQFNAAGGVPPYSWTSTDSQVIQIGNTTGLVTAISLGSAMLALSDATGITVNSGLITVSNLSISPGQAVINVNASQTFTVTGGVPPYTWSVTDSVIATVDQLSGTVTGMSSGSTTLIASDSSGDSTVANLQVYALTISPQTGTTSVTGTIQFSASGGTLPYIWSSTSYGIAAVNATGLLTGVSVGSVIISATDANGIVGESQAITITAAPPQVTLSPANAVLSSGMDLQFSANGGIPPYTWSTSNANIASISAIGLLTALAAGNTTVTVDDSSGGSATSGSINVIDINVLPQNASVNINAALLLAVSGGTAPYTWSVSDAAIANIDLSTGLLTGLTLGQVSVTATDAAGFTGSSNITVQNGGMTIFPTSASIPVGSTQFFSCSGCFMFVNWSSSDPSIASVSFGTVTALSEGVVVISASDGFGNTGSTGAIFITPPPPTIAVIRPTGTAIVGDIIQMSASGGTAPYSWSINNNFAASIDANGLLSALNTGNVIVTATDANGFSGTSTSFQIGGGIAVTPQTVSVNVGSTAQFNAAGGFMFITWSSSDPSLASINNSGLLTALGEGVVTVTAVDGFGNAGRSGVVTISP